MFHLFRVGVDAGANQSKEARLSDSGRKRYGGNLDGMA